MNVLLVVPRYAEGVDANYTYAFPLGLAYISSSLKQDSHHVDCLNLNHCLGELTGVLKRHIQASRRYDVVCTGGVSMYYAPLRRLIETVRALDADARIVLGGGVVSSDPETMFAALSPDFAVLGEGEATIRDLLRCLAEKGDPGTVPGIGFRDAAGQIVFTRERAAIDDLNSIPWPDFDGFEYEALLDHMRPTMDIQQYPFDFPREYPVIGSRSCPYNCTFCFHPLGNRYRERSVDSLMAEVEANVPRFRANIISLYDELFARNRGRVLEFCERMRAFRAKLPWDLVWNCGLRVDGVDRALLEIMKSSGCYMVSYGFESFSELILKSMRKKLVPRQIDQAVQATLDAGLAMHANFIFGDVAETRQTAEETLDYFRRHAAAAINLNFVLPFPGSQLYARCLDRGLIKDRIEHVRHHLYDVINMTETMSDRDFDRLRGDVYLAKLKYSWMAFPRRVEQMGDGACALWVRCPHCRQTVEYRNCSAVRMLDSYPIFCRKCSRRYWLVSRAGFALANMLRLAMQMGGSRLRGAIIGSISRYRQRGQMASGHTT